MTLFVASLYLPYTINFHVAEKEEERGRKPTTAPRPAALRIPAANEPQAGLIQSLASRIGSRQPSPPPTPPVQNAEEIFFVKPPLVSAGTAPVNPESAVPQKLKRALTQPTSRATSPPPASILESKAPAVAPEDRHHTVSGAPRAIPIPKRKATLTDQSQLFSEAEWTVEPAERGNGGLRNAINSALEAGGVDEVTWVGTVGMPTDVLSESVKAAIEDKLRDEHESLAVFCKDSDVDGHYNHFCKQILWPVFHYQIPDNPKSKAYEDHSWIYYVALNQAFADTIVKNYKKGDTIWVHDYHLLLVPKMVRDKIPEASIGFFLHVAFPSSEVYRCLAVRKQLLEGMLGANLVGFQTEEYARHFLQTCNRILYVEATPTGILLEDRFVNVVNSAIGIDPIGLSKQREEPMVDEFVKVILDRYAGQKILVARDKFDHIRGVRQKLLSYELFLRSHPEWVGRVTLIQVALSTSELVELQTTVLDIVSRINASYATFGHLPVVFLHQDISFSQYLALLSVADALVITSLREGMNLTSHEFIFCQDEKHSPLILSEFTGSSALFDGSDISVNPWDYRQCADAMYTALEMPSDEKKARWEKLNTAVMNQTGVHWVTSFMANQQKAWVEQQRRGNMSIPRLSINSVGDAYARADKRIFLLDYEGTLVQAGGTGRMILGNPQRVTDTLNDLLLDSRNIVYVMSSRKPEDLEKPFRLVSGVGLIAENGCFIRPHNTGTWIEMIDSASLGWQGSVKSILEYYQERTPGTTIEKRHCSYIWHMASAEDPNLASRQAGECVNHINDSMEATQRVHAVPLEKAVIVEPSDYNKATAAAKVLEIVCAEEGGDPERWTPDFLFAAGDDREDEVLFKWANDYGVEKEVGHVTTVCVGTRNTEAAATLTQGVTGLISALNKLTKFR
ncbi:Trehalose-phosphatase [Dactylella cylindrospora]|nr:Trehalose-phosphatase [Dactylella cylindrospora]